MATTGFDLVTPAATLYSGQAEMIVCKTVEGEIAFLADHEPYIGALDPCLVRVVGPEAAGAANVEGEFRVAVHGGFVEVKDNQVIMLADIAERPDEVDVDAARSDQSDAQSRVNAAGNEPDQAAETDLKWAHARLEAAGISS
ncbi:MAG TPA: ATP synthase F1 subunit epsilon [Acidimicrobiales bacterium]|nr:ATP synthase F1 subunit epsilon [Acidimicrobiales bacterium]